MFWEKDWRAKLVPQLNLLYELLGTVENFLKKKKKKLQFWTSNIYEQK